MKHFRQIITARSAEEAVDLRKTLGHQGLYIAGGTTVVPTAAPSVEVLIDVSRIGLGGVNVSDGSVVIGATTRISELVSPEVERAIPILYRAARGCATPLIRNMATVGGSLAGISLPSDLGIALLALGAEVTVRGEKERSVGMTQLLADGWLTSPDLVLKVFIKGPAPNQGASFTKFGRSDVDIALVNVAAVLNASGRKVAGLKLVVGQTSSMPVVITGLAEEVAGKAVSASLIERIATLASGQVKPRADFRASADYRRHLIRVLVARSLAEAAEGAGIGLED
jgi:CO/xanthine dehydrogenase FAD-binding subunit